MKKYLIVSRLNSFEFPLREATRKQIWWTAKQRQEEGYNVSILILSDSKKECIIEGINVKTVSRFCWNPFLKADRIHFITGSVSIWLLVGFFWFGKKRLLLTDGFMFGYRLQRFRKLIVRFLPPIFDEIHVLSNYQKDRLMIKKARVELPKLPVVKQSTAAKRSKDPTLLYMGHLSYFKGVDTIILAFEDLIQEFPDLILVIANNGIRGDKPLIDKVSCLAGLYPQNIIIKGLVEPIEELSSAWVYLYPFKEPIGTMAYALSLYEAEQCQTPYVACNVGANKEFFNPDYLIEVNDYRAMVEKVKIFINARKT